MKKFAVVTDSTAYLTEEQFKEFGIKRASLNIIAGDKTYRELEMVNADVYKLFEEGHKLTTSQPSPGEFLENYEELITKGYEKIFVILISKNLSGTFQSANLAKNMISEPSKVYIFDTMLAAYGTEMITEQVIKMVDDNKECWNMLNKY